MSFKFRFILSFVLLEVFFIVLIVTVNFFAIKNSSDKLISEKIESNVTFLEELIKVPMSIYDLATLDNLVDHSVKYLNSIVILDTQNRILSSSYSYKYMPVEELLKLKKNQDVFIDDNTYKIVFNEIYEEDILLGSVYIIFDTTSNSQFIEKSKNTTFLIILLEILISIILSYLLGNRVTKKLDHLSTSARKIGKEENTSIPYLDSSDEIGILANSMDRMQTNLQNRNKTIIESNKLLVKQKEDLETANKVKDDFLANMSHELKTPLNSINVLSSIMKKNSKNTFSEKEVKNLEIINSCGKDLLFLINDVLDISKLEAGKVSINNNDVNIYNLTSIIRDMFFTQFKDKNVDFYFECDKNINSIYSDERKISQIVKNFLSNALKFTSEGKVSLIVKEQSGNVLIEVEDSGIGINKEQIDDLFDRFKQVDASISRKHLGTGLGLAISKNLAELLKGNIVVESEFGHGSKFTLCLPLNINETKPKSTTIIREDSIPLTPNNLHETISEEKPILIQKTDVIVDDVKRKKILIYNNDLVVFFNIIIKLKKKNEIVQVNTENKFLDELSDNSFDFVIIDIDKLSEDFVNKILSHDNKKLIIIASNEVNDDIKLKAKSIILKPIDLNKIISSLDS